MAGIVLQTHHEPTTGRAALCGQFLSNLSVLGGPTLNETSGGIHPKTARAHFATGARFVWFPTTDAAEHIRILGGPGRSLSATFDPADTTSGLSPLAPGGGLTAAAAEVIDIAAEHGGLVGTGHLSLAEADAVVAMCAAAGAIVVINHPFFLLRPSDQWWRDLPSSALVQFAAVDDTTDPRLPRAVDVARLIDMLGPDRCAVGSEAKAPVRPVEALRAFARALAREGLPDQSIRRVYQHRPPTAGSTQHAAVPPRASERAPAADPVA